MIFFLELLNTIHLFHWNTDSYVAHKASDRLYHTLQPLIDKFIEVGLEKNMGTFEEKTIMSCKTLPKMKAYLKQCIAILTKLTVQNDMASLRDEMIGEIHQFLYVVHMK